MRLQGTCFHSLSGGKPEAPCCCKAAILRAGPGAPADVGLTSVRGRREREEEEASMALLKCGAVVRQL